MKKLEFETSKDKFVLVDMQQGTENLQESLINVKIESYKSKIKLLDITENQARKAVDEPLFGLHFIDYTYLADINNKSYGGMYRLNTAIESLHSLIESKGWYLFKNPFKGEHPNDEYVAEDYTLYNPYLFRVKN